LILPVYLSAAEIEPEYILDMDIEDLMSVEVVSVSKYGQLLKDTPAAITVIDQNQIKNSGFVEIPEILRRAPGMQIIRTEAGNWIASARALSFDASGKMLVMVDGRSLFSQDAGTVIWPSQTLLLEDVDRIEVIRGPGGTTWGYNAVNGVVNIISKSSKETQGFLADTTVGSDGKLIVQSRLGGHVGDNIFYKLYVGASDQDQYGNPGGEPVSDMLKKRTGGFRLDYEPSGKSLLTVEGGAQQSTDDFLERENFHETRFFSGKWTQAITEDMDVELFSYYDKSYDVYGRDAFSKGYGITIENITTEFHADWRTGKDNRLMAGGGFKYSVFTPEDGIFYSFLDSRETWYFNNVFFSDEYAILPDRLWLTGGMKLEHNTKSDLDWQPNIRLLYKASPTQSIWAALSRALKIPDYQTAAKYSWEYSVYDQNSGESRQIASYWTGEPLKNEKLTAYEIGHRAQLTATLSSDIALFYNKSTNVSSVDAVELASDEFSYFLKYDNESSAYGSEIALTYNPEGAWSATASYSYLYDEFKYANPIDNHNTHIHRLQLHTQYRPVDHLSLNGHLYWNSEAEINTYKLPSYLRMDLVLTYRLTQSVELSLAGQNLLESEHNEIENSIYRLYNTEIPRSIVFNLKVKL